MRKDKPNPRCGGVELPFEKGDLEGFLKACPDPERSEGERMR